EELVEFDELELPEYGEEEALADSEPLPEASAEPEAAIDEPIDTASLNEAEEMVEFDELDLPEYGEEEALADSEPSPEASAEPEAAIDEPIDTASLNEAEELVEFDELELPEYGEEEALADSEPSPEASAEPETAIDEPIDSSLSSEAVESADASSPVYELEDGSTDEPLDELDIANQQYDEKAFNELLSESSDLNVSPHLDKEISSEVSDSAGMDIEAMLEIGEDWNGFHLSPEQKAEISDEIPDSEREIWDQENAQEQASEENWEDQDDLDDFQPQESEFKTIDELMAEVESEEEQSVDEELKLDVGLNEFPDIIGDIGDVNDDIDANSEAAGKLDLAKIYVEMNDSKGAIKLLEEAIVDGSDEIRQEAKKLIDDINNNTV
ncbi:FimV/HubP family polar landmark protein, partial [Vibrio caribbeanicus]|uniref:FimV/HubP family polar landmark protein n=1 Tax=Vibrio caribbeanicus TaxID=701175 RepID=UPI00228E396A|nr:AAA family ATPase [Vibrio caribbeanicus]